MPFNQKKIEQGIDAIPIILTEHGTIVAGEIPELYLAPPGELPEGIYDTLLIEQGLPRDWTFHWERFAHSCQSYGINIPEFISESRIRDTVEPYSALTLQCRIVGFLKERQLGSTKLQAMVLLREFMQGNGSKGIECGVAEKRRHYDDFSYQHKLTGRCEEEQILAAMRQCGYGDVLFLNDRDEICEAAYSNIVLVNRGKLYTPGEETACLPGVTVKLLLERAKKAQIPVERGPIKLCALESADEVWLTSSLRGVQWVSRAGQFRGPEEAPAESLYSRLILN